MSDLRGFTPESARRGARQRAAASLLAGFLSAMSLLIFGGPSVARDAVVATAGIAANLDPDKAFGTADTIFTCNVFEPLVQLNPIPTDGRGRYIPALATAWTIAPDGKSIDFELRHGVAFHDGTPLTAEDVKFSLERAVAPQTKNPYASSWLENQAGVQILAPDKVRVLLSHPWAGTMDGLAARGLIMPKAYVMKVGDDGFAKAPIGTGPFIFVERRIGDRIELRGFDKYWRGPPKINNLTWRMVPDINTRAALIESGAADLITDVLPSLVSTIRNNGGNVNYYKGTFQRFLIINELRPGPLTDRRVRSALNLAIDRKALFSAVFGRDLPLLNGPLSSDKLGGDAAEPYSYAPNEAKKLLAEAGFGNGFTTDLTYAAGRFVGEQELLPAMASYWKRVGIQVNMRPLEQDKWIEAIRDKAYVGLASFSKASGTVSEPASAFDRHVRCGSLFSAYCNKDLDALLDSAANVVDEAKLRDIFSKAQRMAHDDAAQVFLFDEPSLLATKQGVHWHAEFGPEAGFAWTNLDFAQ